MAVMYDVIIKNDATTDVMIEDLGIAIPATGQVTMSNNFTYDELAGSDDLRTLVSAGTLVVNDGSLDLGASDGVDYLTFGHMERIYDEFYTQTQLQTSGQSQVHWGNLTDVPAFGSFTWLSPVEYRVIGIAADATASATNDVFVDTDDDHYYKWNGASWVDVGTAAEGDRVINIGVANQPIYVYSSGNFVVDSTAGDDDCVVVDDDGDGGSSQYVYAIPGNIWYKVGDVDYAGHFDGGASKHDASEIDVEGTYIYIGVGDLESALADIDAELDVLADAVAAIDYNTLDEAYDQGGAGSGRSITTDSGAVVMDTAAATNSPLELTAKAAAPSSGLADGQLYRDTDGILYTYDATRAKWLSVQRQFVCFGRAGKTKNQYLNLAGGTPSNNAGYRLMRDACVVGISAQLDAVPANVASFQLRTNDGVSAVVTETVTSPALGDHSAVENTNLSAGDFLQAFLSCITDCQDPQMVLEIAWRP
jgi:hypothetical protein